MTSKRKKKKFKKPRERPSLAYRLTNTLSFIFALSGVILVTIVFQHHKWSNNLQHWMHFFACVTGLIICIAIYYLLAKKIEKFSEYEKDRNDKVLPYLVIGALTIFPASTSVLNYMLEGDVVSCEYYPIRDKEFGDGIGRRTVTKYLIFVNGPGFNEVDMTKPDWDKLETGDSVRICIMSGGLGSDYYKLDSDND